jgi:hypothetical protein
MDPFVEERREGRGCPRHGLEGLGPRTPAGRPFPGRRRPYVGRKDCAAAFSR